MTDYQLNAITNAIGFVGVIIFVATIFLIGLICYLNSCLSSIHDEFINHNTQAKAEHLYYRRRDAAADLQEEAE